MEQETSILRYTELTAILHSTSKKELTMHLKTKLFKRLNVLILLFFYYLPVISQTKNFENWQVKDGLPQNSIQQIIQSENGYIWLGTDGGLVRFDGEKFKIFNSKNTPELKANRIRLLHENRKGDLVIATNYGEIVIYRKNKFNAITSFNKKKTKNLESIKNSQIINKIFEDHNGNLLMFSNHTFLGAINSTTYAIEESFDFLKDTEINDVFELDLNLYFRIKDKLYQFKNNQLIFIKFYNKNYNGITVNATNEYSWIVDKNILYKYSNYNVVKKFLLPIEKSLVNNKIITFSFDNYILIANSDGKNIVKFNKNIEVFEVIQPMLGTSFGRLNAIFCDREKNIWYGTSTGGLYKEKQKRFSYLDTENSLNSHNFYPVIKTQDDHIIVGSYYDSFYEFNKDGVLLPRSSNLKPSPITALESYNNAIYFSTNSANSISKYKNGQITEIQFPFDTPSPSLAIYKTNDNKLLVGKHFTIYELINDKLIPHAINKLADFYNISTFFEDSKNQLWIATENAIFCYNRISKNLKTYTHGKSAPNYNRAFYEDIEGRIYVGSYGNGLTVINQNKTFQVNMNHGLAEDVVSTITGDSRGNLWLTGNKGLSRIKKLELIKILENKIKKLPVILYNEETDRMRTGEFNGGVQHSKCKIGAEKYLFPTLNGCISIDFSTFTINNVLPPVHIESLTYGDSVYNFQPALALPYQGERLDISFTALSFVSPKNVHFKYKLIGFDKKWIDGGNIRNTFYTKLPPGSYVFKVIASNNEGKWNQQGASIAIKIIPPYYMTVWFKVIVIVSLSSIAVVILFKFLERTRKREKEKSAMMDILPDLVLKIDRDGNYIDNYGNSTSLIKRFKELKGRSIREFLSQELSEYLMDVLKQAFKTKIMQQFEYDLEIKYGKTQHFEGRIIAKDNSEALLIIRDITDRKQSQIKIAEKEKVLLEATKKERELLKVINKQQKNQLKAIINTEEKERKRIAADLHDGVGQLLTSVKINIAVVIDKINSANLMEVKDILTKSKDLIDITTSEIRNISYNLLPPSLEQFGLSSAIEEELKKMNRNSSYKFSYFGKLINTKFDSKLEVILFRSFQELVNNAVKHSKGSEIVVQLIQHNEKLILMVEDNGIGFDFTQAYQKKDSSGLKNIASRLLLIHGKINVDSSSKSGTSVIIEVII
jgi:signal transduction histidine kinase/ligand-binding sensor domain-containing protein